MINVHMEELSSHWQEEQEKEADGADKYVVVSRWKRSSVESVDCHCPAGSEHLQDQSQHTVIHPEASSSSCFHSRKTYHAELCFFACPLTGVQDYAYLLGLCYRMLGSRLVCRGDQWLKLVDRSFCLRSEERRSASVDSRHSGGSHLDGECSRHRRDRSRSPHRRKRNKDKDRGSDSRRRKER